jgi:hypothetical protein
VVSIPEVDDMSTPAWRLRTTGLVLLLFLLLACALAFAWRPNGIGGSVFQNTSTYFGDAKAPKLKLLPLDSIDIALGVAVVFSLSLAGGAGCVEHTYGSYE